MASYRQIGGQLGAYIRADNPSTQQIHGLLADLLTGDELLLPMRDLVSRKCFINLQPFAGSGRGIVQRDACLQELARSYLPIVVDQISQVSNGMLDLPAQKTRQPQEEKVSSHAAGTEKPTQEPMVASGKIRNKDLLENEMGARRRAIPQTRTYSELANQRARTEASLRVNQSKEPKTGHLSGLQVLIGIGAIIFLISIPLTALESNCAYAASRASLLTTESAEFRRLMKENKSSCMTNAEFKKQYYRECIANTNGYCQYK